MSRLSRLLQEMYPPKVHQFAYVTDDACTEDEILSMEVIIMQVQKVFVGVWKPGRFPQRIFAWLQSKATSAMTIASCSVPCCVAELW